MPDGHAGAISAAKHSIERVHEKTRTIYSAPYCARQKSGELKKFEIEKTLSQNIIEHAQTERAVPIVFAPK